ncbi:unnamed protein product [Arctia plantaginis]|uniref:Uncharacterized protein n=1 Tax=Arctia plantaginis TaxID=874455 RepID=A0A8S1A9M5_ARCPL|nr:unnamed protein product [Arctia plantaginis]
MSRLFVAQSGNLEWSLEARQALERLIFTFTDLNFSLSQDICSYRSRHPVSNVELPGPPRPAAAVLPSDGPAPPDGGLAPPDDGPAPPDGGLAPPDDGPTPPDEGPAPPYSAAAVPLPLQQKNVFLI